MRGGLTLAYGARVAFGKKTFGALASTARKITCGAIPMWNEYFPKGASRSKFQNVTLQKSIGKVVYFPSCITRSMGVGKSNSSELEITKLTEKLLVKAGYEVIYPDNLNKLCCGMAFSSKGFTEAGKLASDELKNALIKASQNSKYPVLCDMSPCLYTMQVNFGEEVKIFEPSEFIMKYLINNLNIKKLDKKVAVFAVCSAKKMGVDNMLYDIAKLCAKEVTIIDSNCCGFAGDRGFLLPELNSHGLRHLKEQVDAGNCTDGYATSRTCEIGLSKNSGITFKNILYLLDEASE